MRFYVPIWIAVLLYFILPANQVFAQLCLPGKPYPLKYSGSPDIKFVTIHSLKEASREIDNTISNDTFRLKNATTGELFDVFYDPGSSGVWDTLIDGTMIWRAGFEVDNASVINIIFSPWELNTGVRIYLYDPDRRQIRGAFSEINNKTTRMLATSYVPGNRIIVEMQVPYGQNYGSLAISGIGCDFTGDNPMLKDGWFGESGPCNPDIICIDDPVVETVKNSVVRIVYKGHERCTGTLINSAQKNKINYILTAGHCFTHEDEANTALFYFEYESPSCNGPDGNDAKSLSGATIRARSSDVDFALLELFEPIPSSYHPYYAGWDNSGIAPQSAFVIHHPLGDVKKFAREEDPLTISTFGTIYDSHTHFLINRWETGTTEPGSSGAPLFDMDGLVQGTLTGGLANCTDPSQDYFQMFSHIWADYPDPKKQLAIWLDPMNTNLTILQGYSPEDTLTNAGYEVIAYPNPASSILQIRFNHIIDEKVHISMYNMQGKLVFDQEYAPFQHMIPVLLRGISDGIYILRIRMDHGQHYLKVAVLK